MLLSEVFRRETASGFYPLPQGCFLCFCFFYSIHDSATMHNHSPQKFSTEPFSLLYAVNLLLRCAVEFGGVGKNV